MANIAGPDEADRNSCLVRSVQHRLDAALGGHQPRVLRRPQLAAHEDVRRGGGACGLATRGRRSGFRCGSRLATMRSTLRAVMPPPGMTMIFSPARSTSSVISGRPSSTLASWPEVSTRSTPSPISVSSAANGSRRHVEGAVEGDGERARARDQRARALDVDPAVRGEAGRTRRRRRAPPSRCRCRACIISTRLVDRGSRRRAAGSSRGA